VGNSLYSSQSTGLSFEAWCIVRGFPQVGVGQSFVVNVYGLDDPDLWNVFAPMGGTHEKFRMMAALGTGFDRTSPNDVYRHHAIWEQLQPGLINLTPEEQAVEFFAYLEANDPLFLTSNFRVAVPVAWGTAQSIGQPIMFPDYRPSGEEATIPEPGSMALLGGGGMLLVYLRRRK
jgi:hypothetical protein